MLPYGAYLEVRERFSPFLKKQILALLSGLSLEFDPSVTCTAAVFDREGRAIATASLQRNTFKCIGIAPDHQGENLTADLFSALLPLCSSQGYSSQFLYTKPGNEAMFSPFGFSRLCTASASILMERPAGGIQSFLSSLPAPDTEGRIGAIVAHCNPLTRGHLYLIEQAADRCDFLYVFILSEDEGAVPSADRIRLVREALRGKAHCVVCPTGQYLISMATFPAYFLHDPEVVRQEWCEIDASMFARWIAPALGITDRFVGTEPLSPVTAAYNRVLSDILPRHGIRLTEIDRIEEKGSVISASRVRSLLKEGRLDEIRPLVPEITWSYLSDPANAETIIKRMDISRQNMVRH